MRSNISGVTCFLSLLWLSSFGLAQTQSFNVGQWFFGKNVTSELPPGVIDLPDNMWASANYTCPLVMTGSKAAPVTSLVCRSHTAGSRFQTVIAEGDQRLAGTRLAIPAAAGFDAGRYLTSMVRPGIQNLYFTSIRGTTTANQSHQIAWRLRNYTTLERVAGAGDPVTVQLRNNTTRTVTLSAAGPIDADPNGREFIYIEASQDSVFGIFEIKPDGVYEELFRSPLPFRDTPWGMGGFAFSDGGLVFRSPGVIYILNPDIKGPQPGLTPVAIQGLGGQAFAPSPNLFPNLSLSEFFRPTDDPTTWYFGWSTVQGPQVPNEMLSVWRDWATQPFYTNQLGTQAATTAATFASGDRVTVLGTGPKGPGTDDFDPNSRINVPWVFTSLWLNRAGNWVKILRDSEVPDATPATPKRYYQGVTAFNCQVEFATKAYDQSADNSGAFYGLYRLYRPCIDSATFDTTTRELVIKGVNLQDGGTEIGVPPAQTPPPGAPLGTLLASRVVSATPTEVHAIVDSVASLDRVLVLINGRVWSDPAPVVVTTNPAPILARVVDVNFDHTVPAPNKLMTVEGLFGCRTESTQTVNYPTVLGNCSVLLDNNLRLPMLYASDRQINFLMPSTLTITSHDIRVARSDANGVFTSAAIIVNPSASSPVAIRANGNVIIVVIRNNQVVVIGPNDPIHPGEYFTIYTTGVDLTTLPATAVIGTVNAQYAAAVVSWAQGVVQMNILAPSQPLSGALVRIGELPPFPVRIE